MLKELIEKLKFKKKQLETLSSNIAANNETSKKEETTFNITISKKNNLYKMVISDYISIDDYVERTRIIDNYNIIDLIWSNVFLNDDRQKVNKGTYYIILIQSTIYIILINDEILEIDERIKKDDIIEEKILSFNKANNNYHYSSLKHTQTGSTFYIKYYDKKDNNYGIVGLSQEQASEEINLLFNNLENIENIKNILDIDLLKSTILNDLDKTPFQRQLKLQ